MADPAQPATSHRIQYNSAPSRPPQAHLVLGHDQHPRSQDALTVAADLARRLSAQVHVVHGIDLNAYPLDHEAEDWAEEVQPHLDDRYKEVAAALADSDAGWVHHASIGDPIQLLARVADETDALMIIVGSRGEGPSAIVSRIFERSVSHGLIARQHRPVLVVPNNNDHPAP